MARARNIKPQLFLNDELGEKEPLARLLFIGLWCLADREGYLEDKPKKIKAELLPYDNCDVDELLNQLDGHFITRYEVKSGAKQGRYIYINNFAKHQHPHIKEEVNSEIPRISEINNALDKYDTSMVQVRCKNV